MRGRSTRRTRRVALVIGLTALALTVLACASDAPQDTLQPEGPVARQADNLFRPVFWIAVVIFFGVELGLVYIVYRYRRRSDDDAPKQIHGNKRLEIIWTILPAALLAGIAVPTVLTIFDVSARPVGANVVHVKVTGHQWWWEYEYTDFKTPEGVTLKTANELVIPTGRWVDLAMTSGDVIHSFWIPKLAGKQDVVPNRTTYLKLRAETPGVYRGQCAEFCAISHANMRALAIAQTPADFDRWVTGQLRPASMPADPLALARLTATCAQCHTIRGIPNVAGVTAPDLTHFGSRETFAGATFPITEALLFRWMDNPTEMKPLEGTIREDRDRPSMPDYNLSRAEIDAIVAYLMSLE